MTADLVPVNLRGFISWVPRDLTNPPAPPRATNELSDDQRRTPAPTGWLTATEAAAHARRHRNTILIALRTGKLTGFQQKSPQGAWRIHRQDLEAWIKGRS